MKATTARGEMTDVGRNSGGGGSSRFIQLSVVFCNIFIPALMIGTPLRQPGQTAQGGPLKQARLAEGAAGRVTSIGIHAPLETKVAGRNWRIVTASTCGRRGNETKSRRRRIRQRSKPVRPRSGLTAPAEFTRRPWTGCAGRLAEAGKLMKNASFMALCGPTAHFQLNQYIPGHRLGKAING